MITSSPTVYPHFKTVFQDRSTWALPYVLRQRVLTHGDRVFLEFPETGESYTYRETLRLSEYVGANLLKSGAGLGDRVVVMAHNCTGYVFSWFGINLAGLVEVPINTAYR